MDIGLENAGAYLGDTFGPLMRVIWGVGLLAAGARWPSVSFALVPTASSRSCKGLSSSCMICTPYSAPRGLLCSTGTSC